METKNHPRLLEDLNPNRGFPGSPNKTQGFTEGLLKGQLNRFPFNHLVVFSVASSSSIDIDISSVSAAGFALQKTG